MLPENWHGGRYFAAFAQIAHAPLQLVASVFSGGRAMKNSIFNPLVAGFSLIHFGRITVPGKLWCMTMMNDPFPSSIDRNEARMLRARCRAGKHRMPTSGQAPGFVQANLVVLPKSHAYDFLLFCQRNPKPCPLLDVTDPGDPEPRAVAPAADIRTDLPLYRVYSEGRFVDEVPDILDRWREDLVSFLLGCSFTFEMALMASGLRIRHLEERHRSGRQKNVPMYRTNLACRPAGVFHGPMVVSMRPFSMRNALRASAITSRYPRAHGAPIHMGDPAAIGIEDINQPDWGDPVTVRPGEVPVFWACGVTPQALLLESKLEIAFTHSPGHMFACDLRDEELAFHE